mmetsp:Transcript_20173/g.17340  ORF Transcript_20173/g.17340 Transcript_20173/m.17340 type:complete len:184 (+) Transcript_20173:522-1073(+)|eukprot:CAMPEP_0114587112 /NCGR_PEP_ID=MMETSP0125-20121206/10156_1 /TAXON_ID=485358 ORGANISM="Aristerostoma sp., Strain ATCC 50986" /NCGR_SAMPLE_ID=MMETSP0125 /ASSEMBLY_ACC=CAM_ASM_000245 /LENGTH=183 /DNA_ID=CAMNT_0001782865 /DNA_START=468 /DNA_END=1019 /DNA_ORIENTATION=+
MDYLLESYKNCPNYYEKYLSHLNDSTVQEVFAEMNSSVKSLQAKGVNIENIGDMQDLGDTVTSDFYFGRTPPYDIQVENTNPEYLDLIFASQWYEVYPALAEQDQISTFAAPLLWYVNDNINGIRNGTNPLKFIFLSAHESTLMVLLAAFNISYPECMRKNWEAKKAGTGKPYPNCDYPLFAS